MADEDDATFYVGALRCRAQASWLVKIGVRQLPTALQTSVKMRVGEDREQAVRRCVEQKHLAAAAALIDEPALSPPPPQPPSPPAAPPAEQPVPAGPRRSPRATVGMLAIWRQRKAFSASSHSGSNMDSRLGARHARMHKHSRAELERVRARVRARRVSHRPEWLIGAPWLVSLVADARGAGA